MEKHEVYENEEKFSADVGLITLVTLCDVSPLFLRRRHEIPGKRRRCQRRRRYCASPSVGLATMRAPRIDRAVVDCPFSSRHISLFPCRIPLRLPSIDLVFSLLSCSALISFGQVQR